MTLFDKMYLKLSKQNAEKRIKKHKREDKRRKTYNEMYRRMKP